MGEQLWVIEIEIGFLWFSQMRAVLRSYAWRDPNFKWSESPGWLDKTFYTKGSKTDIVELQNRFDGWCDNARPERVGL